MMLEVLAGLKVLDESALSVVSCSEPVPSRRNPGAALDIVSTDHRAPGAKHSIAEF